MSHAAQNILKINGKCVTGSLLSRSAWPCTKLEEEGEGKNKNTGAYLLILVPTAYENIYKVFTLFKVLRVLGSMSNQHCLLLMPTSCWDTGDQLSQPFT